MQEIRFTDTYDKCELLKSKKHTFNILTDKKMPYKNIPDFAKQEYIIINFMMENNLINVHNDSNIKMEAEIYHMLSDLTTKQEDIEVDDDKYDICTKYITYFSKKY